MRAKNALLLSLALCVASQALASNSGFSGGSSSSSSKSPAPSPAPRAAPAPAPRPAPSPPPAARQAQAPAPAPKAPPSNNGFATSGSSRESSVSKAVPATPAGATNQIFSQQAQRQAAVEAYNADQRREQQAKADAQAERARQERLVREAERTRSAARDTRNDDRRAQVNPPQVTQTPTYQTGPSVIYQYPRERVVIVNGAPATNYPPVQQTYPSAQMDTSVNVPSVSGTIGGERMTVREASTEDRSSNGHPVLWFLFMLLVLSGAVFVLYKYWYVPKQEVKSYKPKHSL